jgi:hypothetical protein
MLDVDHDGDARIIDWKGAGATVDIGWDEAKPGATPEPPKPPAAGHKGGCSQGGLADPSVALLLLGLASLRRRSGSRTSTEEA